MKVIVFGAGGGVGRMVVEWALKAGHEVTAAARFAEAVKTKNPNLTVVEVDVTDANSVKPLLAKQEAVISTLGVKRNHVTTYMSTGIANIIQGMHNHNVKRLVCVSSGGVNPQRDPNNSIFFEFLVKKFYINNVLNDFRRMEKLVMESGLDWTIVRPMQVIGEMGKGEYRVAEGYSLPDGRKITLADLAHFVVKVIENDEYIHKGLAIANI